MNTSPPPVATLTPARLGDELDALLDALRAAHERLREVTRRQRDGLRAADPNALALASREQEEVARQLAGLDARRRDLVARACTTLGELARRGQARVTLSDLASHAPPARRGALLRKAESLRGLIRSVQQEVSGVRAATSSLLAHVEGVVRQVGRELSHAGTYSSRGIVAPVAGVVSALDIRS